MSNVIPAGTPVIHVSLVDDCPYDIPLLPGMNPQHARWVAERVLFAVADITGKPLGTGDGWRVGESIAAGDEYDGDLHWTRGDISAPYRSV